MDPIKPGNNIIFSDDKIIFGNNNKKISPSLKISVDFQDCNINNLRYDYLNINSNPKRLDENLTQHKIFDIINLSLNISGLTLIDKLSTYIDKLPQDDKVIIINEYNKYGRGNNNIDSCEKDENNLSNRMDFSNKFQQPTSNLYTNISVEVDFFVYGLICYLTFLMLNDIGVFSNFLPFQFTLPYSIDNRQILSKNFLKYVSLPLIAISKISTGFLSKFTLFIQTFINIWEPIFYDGPVIDYSLQTRLCIDIISGLSCYNCSTILTYQQSSNNIYHTINNIEDKLNNSSKKLISDTRRDIEILVDKINSTVNFVDDATKDKINILIDSQLNDFFSNKLSLFKESIIHDVIIDLKNSPPYNSSFNQLNSKIIELERRIQNISNNIPFQHNSPSSSQQHNSPSSSQQHNSSSFNHNYSISPLSPPSSFYCDNQSNINSSSHKKHISKKLSSSDPSCFSHHQTIKYKKISPKRKKSSSHRSHQPSLNNSGTSISILSRGDISNNENYYKSVQPTAHNYIKSLPWNSRRR